MAGAIRRWLGRRHDYDRRLAQTEDMYKSQVRQLQEEVKLRDLQIKNLVAENQRNFERLKAETAVFSAQVVTATSGRN